MNKLFLKTPLSFLLVCFAFLFLSCQSSVEFDSLQYDKSKGKFLKDNNPYSGKAVEKNQNDYFLRKAEYNNGYLVLQKKWEYPRDKKVLVEDMEYKNGEEFTGFKKEIGNYDHIDFTIGYAKIKNGELKKIWKMEVDGLFAKRSVLLVADGENIKDKKPKELCSENKFQYNAGNVNREKLEKFLNCIESQDIEGFEIFKEE